MAEQRRAAVDTRRRRRDLASDARTARYARSQAWDRALSFVRTWWPALAACAVLVPVSSIPAALTADGAWRGAVLGAAVASGLWLAAVIAVVFCGATTRFVGATAEEWTAIELRRLRRDGWRLVNGLKVRGDYDVDHVVVGPGGALVVETKWSADAWPMTAGHRGFMSDRLVDAAGAARRNAGDVSTLFRGELGVGTIRPIVVVWSPEEPPDGPEVREVDGVTVVRGGALRQWLEKLEPASLSPAAVTRAWSQLDKQARIRDDRDVQHGTLRPSPMRLLWQWVGQPLLGFMVAIYASLAIGLAHDWRLWLLGLIFIGLVCFVGHRRPSLRHAARGGELAVIAMACAGVVVLLAR